MRLSYLWVLPEKENRMNWRKWKISQDNLFVIFLTDRYSKNYVI